MSPVQKNRCHICKKKYSRKDSLMRHIATVHGDMETESSQSRESSLNGEDDEEQVMLPRWIVSRILEVLSKYLKS